MLRDILIWVFVLFPLYAYYVTVFGAKYHHSILAALLLGVFPFAVLISAYSCSRFLGAVFSDPASKDYDWRKYRLNDEYVTRYRGVSKQYEGVDFVAMILGPLLGVISLITAVAFRSIIFSTWAGYYIGISGVVVLVLTYKSTMSGRPNTVDQQVQESYRAEQYEWHVDFGKAQLSGEDNKMIQEILGRMSNLGGLDREGYARFQLFLQSLSSEQRKHLVSLSDKDLIAGIGAILSKQT